MGWLASKAAPRDTGVMFFDVDHDGATYRVHIRRVTVARRITLRVRTATRDALVTLPTRASLVRAERFVARHAAWIGTRLARLPEATPFGAGARIPVRGVPHEIVHRPGARGTVCVEPGEDGPRLCVSGEAPFVARRVQDWLMRQARADLAAAVARHAETLGVVPKRLTLRDTTSRWGSCSSSGALNFSWRLVMAPPHVLDYLAAHEVAHMKHMNHSSAYWAVVDRLDPHYAVAEAWLKRHGSGLLHYGSSSALSR